jgi:hypothetical protein
VTASVLGKFRRLIAGIVIGAVLMGIAPPLHAVLTVLVGEPFGSFGTMMPLGHTAIYLDRVCADGPLHVRMCEAGERSGAVLARYHSIGRRMTGSRFPYLNFCMQRRASKRCRGM